MKNFFFLSITLLSLFFIGCDKNAVEDQAVPSTTELSTTTNGSVTDQITERGPECGCPATLTKTSSGTVNIAICGENINQGSGTSCNSSFSGCINYSGSTVSTQTAYTLTNAVPTINFCSGEYGEDFKITNNSGTTVTFNLNLGLGNPNSSITLKPGKSAYIAKTDGCAIMTPICKD